MARENPKPRLALAVLFLAAFSSYLFLLPRLSIGLPLHSDEYDNIALAQDSIKGSAIFAGDPYAPPPGKSIYFYQGQFYDLESGYIALLVYLSLASGLSPEALAIFFPFLVSLMVLLANFVFLRLLLKEDFTALAGSLFIFFIPSSQLMLGPFYLVASSLGLVLIPVMLLLGFYALAKNKGKKTFIAFVFASTLIYPPAAVAAIIALASFLLCSPQPLRKNFKQILAACAIFLSFFVAFLSFIMAYSGFNPLKLLAEHGASFIFAAIDFSLDQLFLRANAIPGTPFITDYLGLPLSLLSFFALLFFIVKEFRKPEPSLRLIYIPAIFLALIAFLSLQIGRGILIPAERAILYASYFLLACSGIFAAELFAVAKSRLAQGKIAYEKSIAALLIILLFAAIAFSQPLKRETLMLNIAPNELDGIEWIKQNTKESSLILAAPYISKPIHVFTGRGVFCTSATRYGCPSELNLLASSFFFANCGDKGKILEEYFRADYIFMQKNLLSGKTAIEFPDQNCPFLEKAFEGANIIIYKSKLTKSS